MVSLFEAKGGRGVREYSESRTAFRVGSRLVWLYMGGPATFFVSVLHIMAQEVPVVAWLGEKEG